MVSHLEENSKFGWSMCSVEISSRDISEAMVKAPLSGAAVASAACVSSTDKAVQSQASSVLSTPSSQTATTPKQSLAQYNAAILQCKNLKIAKEIFEQIQKNGFKPNSLTYMNLIKICKVDELSEGLKLFNEATKNKLNLGDLFYESLINLCIEAGKLEEALSVLDDYVLFHKPKISVFRAFIALCQKDENFSRGCLALEMMEVLEIIPDANIYHRLISMAAQEVDFEMITVFLHKMKKYKMSPFTETYNHLIHTAVKSDNPALAIAFFEHMKKNGKKPTAVTYNNLIRVALMLDDLPQALMRLQEMVNQGMQPDPDFYGRLIAASAEIDEKHLLRMIQHSDS